MEDKKQKSQHKARMAFVIAVFGCAVLFMLYFGLFKEPRQRLAEKVQTVSEAIPREILQRTPRPTAAPTPTPEPTPTLPPFDISSWQLMMANDGNRLDASFVPESLTEIADGQSVDSRIAENITVLLSDAEAAGYTDIYFCSGYRSYDTQYSIYWNHIWSYEAQGYDEQEAESMTKLAVNAPGASEHQLGLSADLLEYYGQDMEPYIGGSGLMLWLEQHCTEYGFIIRYPEGKTDITGVEYEPWHLRYVGQEAAEYITENGLCLEEFIALYTEAN